MIYAPTSLVKGIRALLIQQIAAMRGSLLGRIAMLQQSTTDDEDYAWLGEPPRMRQIGEDDALIYDGLSDAQYTVTNQTWKAGLKINRRRFDDQQAGIISRRIQQLAQVGANHVNRMIISSLIDGDVTDCYDGEEFFDNAHPARGQQTATQDNIAASSGTTTSQIQTDVGDAIESLMSIVAENGEPFTEEITKIAIVYPVGIDRQMREATQARLISNTDNLLATSYSIDLIPSSRLALDDAADYYVLDVSDSSDLPLILQERDGLEVDQKLDGDDAFDNEIYKFKVRWRGAPAYGHWQRAIKVA